MESLNTAFKAAKQFAQLPNWHSGVWERYWIPWCRKLEASPLAYRFAQGAWWSVVASFLPRPLMIGASVAMARILGKEGFGELGMVQSTVMMLGTFAGFGLGLTATKYVAELRHTNPKRAGRVMGLSTTAAWVSGIVFALAVLALAPVLAARTLAAPQLTAAMRIASLLILLGAVTGEQTGALAGFEAFKTVARINLFTAVATFSFMIPCVFWGGLEGGLWGLAAAGGLNWWMNDRALRRETGRAGICLDLKRCYEEWPLLVGFSLPAVASAMLAAPVNWICNAILANRPGGYAEMGALNAANQFYFALLFLPGMLVRATTPMLTERWTHRDLAGCRQILNYSMRVNIVAVLPAVLLGCLVSPFIMAVYGKEFQDQSATLAVALITSGVLAFQMPVGQLTAATSRMWLETLMNLTWALIYCATTWLLIAHGALAVVTGRLIAYLFHTAVTGAYAFWILRERPASGHCV